MNDEKKNAAALERLTGVLKRLRAECPWDRKQTFESLRPNTVEEAHELSEAILSGNSEAIKEEAGDVLLHVLFYALLASEQGAFDFSDIADSLTDKLIYRHPHIYGHVQADTPEAVKKNWEALKLKRKTGGLLSGVPRSLPALVKAYRLGEKASSVGFDWKSPADVWAKVKEEVAEIEEPGADLEEEFGDLFFALAQAARLHGVDPDAAAERANRKFIARFNYMESRGPLAEMTDGQREQLWQEAKEHDIHS